MSSPLLVAVAGAAAVLFLWIGAAPFVLGGTDGRRRLERFVIARPDAAADGEREVRPSAARSVVPLLRSAGRPVLRYLRRADVAAVRQRLAEAGDTQTEPLAFIELQYGAGAAGAAAGVLLALLLGGTLELLVIGLVGGALLGYAVPGVALDRKARARRRSILMALPASLDMLALCADAGLGLDAAMTQVVQRWNNPLSDEFRRFLIEFQIGRDRRQAMRELARRSAVPEVIRFANAVTHADTLGVALAKVLEDQATEVRVRRRQRAEEEARKAPIKMLFPMVLLIFPALFIVILGPAVPRLLNVFTIGP